MNILVTGGAGYIGSHTLIELLNTGHEVCVIDNLSNSSIKTISSVELITGKKIKFYKVDLLNISELDKIFKDEKIDYVIHFAGLKSVSESFEIPFEYYRINVQASIVLFELMLKYKVRNIVFSSSATVYGDPLSFPITESFELSPINPYGRTKFIVEEILRDMYKSGLFYRVSILRYFNPLGAHSSGLIGENLDNQPNNLMPVIARVFLGKQKTLKIFGNNYETIDGTALRDYIHVQDLANAHLKAIEFSQDSARIITLNVGTGHPHSVMEVIESFENASGVKIKTEICDRRLGDAEKSYTSVKEINNLLSWKPKRDLNQMCFDTVNWLKTQKQV